MIKADCLVDDGIHNLIGGDYQKILFTAPHNTKYKHLFEEGIVRADDWKDVYNIITKILFIGDD